MPSEVEFFIEVLINGLLSGILYSLVAIGFVLIYKASGVFNFGQGAMVLFAAMSLVGIGDWGLSTVPAALLTMLVMVALACCVEWTLACPKASSYWTKSSLVNLICRSPPYVVFLYVCWPISFSVPVSACRCARLPMIIRPPFLLASRSARCGLLFGAPQDLSAW
jgi:hypothetical protein